MIKNQGHRPRRRTHPARTTWMALSLGLSAALLVSACGSDEPTAAPTAAASAASSPVTASGTADGPATSADAATTEGSTPAPAVGGEVTLVTHDSFNVDKALLDKFQADSGITVTVLAQGDSGAMLNQLVLTKDNPLGDAVFGIDNTFASRALDAGVLAEPATVPTATEFDADATGRLVPIDYGDVCVNVDHTWFKDKGLAEPTSFEDLALPQYKDLFVTPSPATSSPGLAFLLGTVAHFGASGWQPYWQSLKDNGVKVTGGWSDAYSVDFSGSSGKGDRPLVLSYASSPPYEVAEGSTTAPTGALLDTCFRQVEYAGVLAGAKNPAAAAEVVKFLQSTEFQAQIPEQMYVYPVDPDVALPADWAKYATPATDPATLDPADITANREGWIQEWSDLVEG